MTYQLVNNALLSIISAIHETYYPGTRIEIQDIIACLWNVEGATLRQRAALIVIKHLRNTIAHRTLRSPTRVEIADAAHTVVQWLKKRCPTLDDPCSKFEGYYWAASCVVELCERLIDCKEEDMEYEESDEVETEKKDCKIEISGLSADASIFIPLETNTDTLFVAQGTFGELRAQMKQKLQRRKLMILSGSHKGKICTFRGGHGTVVKIVLDGEDFCRFTSNKNEAGLLRYHYK